MAKEVERVVSSPEMDIRQLAEWMKRVDKRIAELDRINSQMRIMIRIHGIGTA